MNIAAMTKPETGIAEYNATAAALDALRARLSGVAYDVSTGKGMDIAKRDRAEVRDLRVALEKKRVELKAPALERSRLIDAEAKRITAELVELEQPIDEQIKAEEQRKEEERQAKINAEAGRVLAIQEALAEIAQDVQIACGKTSADVGTLLHHMMNTKPDPLVFQEMIDAARAAWDAAITKLETAYKAKLWDEEQAAERAAAEAARKRQQEAEDAERARVSAEQAAEATRLKEAADKLAADQAELTRQLEALKAAQAPAPAPVEPPAPAPQPIQAASVPADPLSYGGAPFWTSTPDTRPPINTGTLCTRLGFNVTAEFLQGLGIKPAERPATAKAGTFWKEADFVSICRAIARHVEGVAAGVAA